MVIPTPRLLLFAVAGVALVVLTGSHDAGLTIALLWLAAIVVLALVDAFLAPRSGQVHWTRDHENKLSLGVWNAVTLDLHSSLQRPVALRVRDAVPGQMAARGESRHGECTGSWRFSYRVFPIHRGDYRFGPVTARYLGPLGLAWKQRSVDLDDNVKVYPNLQAIRNYEMLLRRGHLAEIGLHNSRRWGEGTEFERLRSYSPDDQYRRINWKATAKTGSPIVVDYQTERSQNVIIALDTGRLMATRLPLAISSLNQDEAASEVAAETAAPVALTRLDFSVNAALLLSFVSQEYGDRVGLLAFSDRVTRYVAPRSGRRQFLLLTESLYNLEAEATATDFLTASAYLGRRNPRRSLIVLFTDLAESYSAAQLVSTMAQLRRRHLPLVVTMQDPEIQRLATQAPRDTRSVYERSVARQLLDERAKVLVSLRAAGVLTLDVRADALTPSVINRYLEVKARSAL